MNLVEIQKIYNRQIDAINKFGFLTIEELERFCDLTQKKYNDRDRSLIDSYFKLSVGYRTLDEHKVISKKLARFIKLSIKDIS